MDKVNHIVQAFAARFAAQHGSEAAQRVKIAILDTGCDMSAPCIKEYKGYARLVGRWYDFVAHANENEADEPVDEDPTKHGTAVTGLLLRCTERSKIYIIRVAKDKERWDADKVAEVSSRPILNSFFSFSFAYKC